MKYTIRRTTHTQYVGYHVAYLCQDEEIRFVSKFKVYLLYVAAKALDKRWYKIYRKNPNSVSILFAYEILSEVELVMKS